MSFFRVLRQAALLIVLVIASSAQQGVQATQSAPSATPNAPQSDGSTVRSVASLVVVDMVVSDRDKPVKGLQRQDFRIFEDGQEQTIKIFEEHNSADASQIQNLPPLPANTYSNFPETTAAANVLLLDALNTPTKDQMSVRRQMIEYLKNIPVGTRVAIFTLASRLRLVEGFTSDGTALLAALSSRRNGPSESPILPDPDDTSLTNLDADMAGIGSSSQVMDSLMQFQADQAAFQIDLRVGMTLDALKQLAGYLGGIPGRKNLLWFSGSFPLSLDPGPTLSNEFSAARVYSDRITATNDLLTASRVAVYPIDARGLFPPSVFNAGNPNSNYSGMSRGAPGGLNPTGSGGAGGGGHRARQPMSGNKTNPNEFGSDSSKFVQTTAAEHATMQQIAQETGGQAFYDTNAIGAAIANTIENGENYYTLAYSPNNLHFDGKFRRIQVQGSEKTYRLAYRQGYFADSPVAHASNAPLNPSVGAIQRGAPPSSEVLFKVRVLPSDDPALKGLQPQAGPAGLMSDKLHGPLKRYWMDYAVDMHRVANGSGPDGLHRSAVEFVVIAYDHDGKILNVANRTFKLNLHPAQYERIMQTGLPLHQEIDVPTGEVYLRIGVHDLSTGRVGSIEIPLRVSVPPLQK